MAVVDDARTWANVGIRKARVMDEYVLAPQEFILPEIAALIRAAYVAGYMDAHDDPAPSTILDACQNSEILKLVLPLSS